MNNDLDQDSKKDLPNINKIRLSANSDNFSKHLEKKRNSESAIKINAAIINQNKISLIKHKPELSKIPIPIIKKQEDELETRPNIEK